MSDDVRRWTAELAADPDSRAFLPLGEALRRRGLLEAAWKVARSGVARHPALAGAYDLLARILVDRGDEPGAADAWRTAVRLDPSHAGAHKGLGFLAFRAGDDPLAASHLEQALAVQPDDPGAARALARVRARRAGVDDGAAPVALPAPEASDGEVLVVDREGLVLGGEVRQPGGERAGEAIAAQLAGAAREAARAARLTGLGDWQLLTAEGAGGPWQAMPAGEEALVFAAYPDGCPGGRATLATERAARFARRWVEAMR